MGGEGLNNCSKEERGHDDNLRTVNESGRGLDYKCVNREYLAIMRGNQEQSGYKGREGSQESEKRAKSYCMKQIPSPENN
jgi:hypothetical protein